MNTILSHKAGNPLLRFRKSATKALSLIFAAFVLASGVNAQSPSSKVLPLEPADLLNVLPACPDGWKITASNAANSISALNWLVATAVRDFSFTPPPNPLAAQGSNENLPQTTHIMISDGGSSSPMANAFDNFTPGSQGDGGRVKLMVMGYPAIETTWQKDRPERLMILINNRFFAVIEATNQRPKATEQWAKQINFSALASARTKTAERMPNPVIITRVDELNKENNRSYPLVYNQARD